jgi:hypothetical protein
MNKKLAKCRRRAATRGKPRLFIPLLLLIAFFMVGTVAAQTPVTAVVIAPEGSFTVGDPVELQLAVTHPAGYHIIQPELPQNWGDFFVKSQSPAATVPLEDGTEMTMVVIDTRLFAPGEFSTPPLTVSVTDGAGQLSEVTAAPVPVTLTSVLVEGDSQLRDIKPQAELPFVNLLPWIAGGLLLAALVAIAFLWWKRRQARLVLAAVDNRLPHEIALDDLTRIRQLGLPEQNRFKEHYTLVSDTIRIYVERTQGVPMLERTTGEIRSGLRNSSLTANSTRQLIVFLEESDLVKFSKFLPSEAEAYELITQARQIVEETKPIVIAGEDLDDSLTANSTPTDHNFSSNGKMKNVEVSA